MKILCIGDIVGTPGCEMIYSQLKYLIKENDIDFVIANGENAATGNGITKEKAEKLLDSGVNVITLGNHAFSKPDSAILMNSGFPMVRPINLPEGTPGKGYIIKECNGKRIGIINALGRVFLNPIDSPFDAVKKCVNEISDKTDIIIVDFHAEATSEKAALAWYLDGKITALFGTHTHVQTADERLLPSGSAFISDIGMVGPYNSVLGMSKDVSISRFVTLMNKRYAIAEGNCILCGIIIETEGKLPKSISRIKIC
ncbi:MAG: TIGR00282 family metallophosphoesterase [Clostridia bacterium]|nr:TIGR00282 family metallophosphoesterase [Clostridia bacterium]